MGGRGEAHALLCHAAATHSRGSPGARRPGPGQKCCSCCVHPMEGKARGAGRLGHRGTPTRRPPRGPARARSHGALLLQPVPHAQQLAKHHQLGRQVLPVAAVHQHVLCGAQGHRHAGRRRSGSGAGGRLRIGMPAWQRAAGPQVLCCTQPQGATHGAKASHPAWRAASRARAPGPPTAGTQTGGTRIPRSLQGARTPGIAAARGKARQPQRCCSAGRLSFGAAAVAARLHACAPRPTLMRAHPPGSSSLRRKPGSAYSQSCTSAGMGTTSQPSSLWG